MNSTYCSTMETMAGDLTTGKVSTGTSIMAVEYNGGVVIGADSRTSMGAFISNRYANKVSKIADYVCVCRSGGAADTQAVCDIVKYRLNMLSMELGEPVTVRTAANDFKQICYGYRDSLSVGVIVAGWDRKKGGQVFSIPMGGMMSREKCCLGGSGSVYLYGYVDSNYRSDMSEEECINFVAKGLSLAMWRDGSSGGVIRLATINEKGISRNVFSGDQVPQYYQ